MGQNYQPPHALPAAALNPSGSFGATQGGKTKKFPPQTQVPFGSNEERQLNKLTNMAQYTPGIS